MNLQNAHRIGKTNFVSLYITQRRIPSCKEYKNLHFGIAFLLFLMYTDVRRSDVHVFPAG